MRIETKNNRIKLLKNLKRKKNMTGHQLIEKLQSSWNLDAEAFVNTTEGEFKIFDVIGTMNDEITIECVNPNTGNTMEPK